MRTLIRISWIVSRCSIYFLCTSTRVVDVLFVITLAVLLLILLLIIIIFVYVIFIIITIVIFIVIVVVDSSFIITIKNTFTNEFSPGIFIFLILNHELLMS